MREICVYIIECSDKSLYTGYTVDLEKRLKKHNSGLGAKYTRSRLPVSLKWCQSCKTKSEAMKLECKIKKLKRVEKIELCSYSSMEEYLSRKQVMSVQV